VWEVLGYIATVTGILGVSVSTSVPVVRRKIRAGVSTGRKRLAARRASRRAVTQRKVYAACIAVQTASGRVIPVRREGHRPAKITYSDGSVNYFFGGDMDAYAAAMHSGSYPLARTFHGAAPTCPCGPAVA
jgi:hypothetical protein